MGGADKGGGAGLGPSRNVSTFRRTALGGYLQAKLAGGAASFPTRLIYIPTYEGELFFSHAPRPRKEHPPLTLSALRGRGGVGWGARVGVMAVGDEKGWGRWEVSRLRPAALRAHAGAILLQRLYMLCGPRGPDPCT